MLDDAPQVALHGVVVVAVLVLVNKREQSPKLLYTDQITMFAGVGKPTIAKLIKLALVAPVQSSLAEEAQLPDANAQSLEGVDV